MKELALKSNETFVIQLLILLGISKLILIFGLYLYDTKLSILDEKIYAQYDAGHYLYIAETGYECFKCFEKFGGNWNKNEWCGNAGWFPGYPFTIKLVNLFINDFKKSSFLINHLFVIGIILLISRLLDYNHSKSKFLLLLLAVICPGFIYYYAIFPMAGTLFFILLSIYGYLHKYQKLNLIGLFFATIFYPTGAFLIIPMAMTIFVTNKYNYRIAFKETLPLFITVVLGLFTTFGIMYYYTHHFDAYFLVSSKYNNHLHLPFKDMWKQFTTLFISNDGKLATRTVQSVICMTGVAIIGIINWKRYKDNKLNTLELLATLYILAYLLLPWSFAGDISSYRSESLLLPFVFCHHQFHKWVISAMIVVFCVVGVLLSLDFFSGVII